MKLPAGIERIKLSQKSKDSLMSLRRKTGVNRWNTLCRWAFLLSLAEPKIPKDSEIPSDSNVEMGWKTFGGEYDQLMLHLLVERCLQDSIDINPESIAQQFKLHLDRGIGYLSAKGKINDISDLVKLPLHIQESKRAKY